MSKIFTDDIKQYISENYKGCRYKDLANKINQVFNTVLTETQVANFCCRNGFNNGCPRGGEETRFKKGNVSWLKGKHIANVHPNFKAHQFKKGNIPPNAKPIGTEIISKDGYVYVRVECRGTTKSGKHITFIPKHHFIWEQKYGEIPEGYKLIFLDGNKENFDISNFMLVSDAENLEMIRSDLRSTNSDITKAGVLVAKIDCKIREINKNASERKQTD